MDYRAATPADEPFLREVTRVTLLAALTTL